MPLPSLNSPNSPGLAPPPNAPGGGASEAVIAVDAVLMEKAANPDAPRSLTASACPSLQACKAILETVRLNLPNDTRGRNLGLAVFDEASEMLRAITENVNTCRKIKETPMTLGYVTTLRSILVLWLITLPVALIGEFHWLATPVTAFIGFLFLTFLSLLSPSPTCLRVPSKPVGALNEERLAQVASIPFHDLP